MLLFNGDGYKHGLGPSRVLIGHRGRVLVLRIGLRTMSHKADVLKAALKPITARQRVKLVAGWLDKLWLVAGIGARVG